MAAPLVKSIRQCGEPRDVLQVLRVILVVAVQVGGEVAAGGSKSEVPGRTRAAVLRVAERADARIGRGPRCHGFA